MPSGRQPEIVRNEQQDRFELPDAPGLAYLEYRRGEGRLTLVHTEVDDELEGQGVASALVREALAHAQDEDLTVVPECRFVAGWLQRHPDRAERLDIEVA
jgi:uncharacterized protein